MDWSILLVLFLIIFVAAFIKSAFAFGDALFSMPLMLLVVPFETAKPLVAALALTTSLWIVLQDWQGIQLRAVARLLLGAAIGIPLGIQVLSFGSPDWIKPLLGVILITFSFYKLFSPNLGRLHTDAGAFIFGGLSGFLGGAYNVTGPPVVIYGTLRQWSPANFRVSLQSYFIFTSFLIVGQHLWNGDYTPVIGKTYAMAIPVLLSGIWVGKQLNKAIANPQRFNRYLYVMLIILGITLFL